MAKKNFWLGILVITLVFGMSVFSCNTEDETDGLDSKLVGTWVNSDTTYKTTYKFGKDGKFNDSEALSWSTSEGVITLTSSTGYGFTYTANYKVSGSTLTLSESSNVLTLLNGTYTKQ
ncbi:MAG: hypothetical protein LBQ82_03300 [Treponema sp.]|nr:hypothetical protein [Treponema sp.]